MNTLLIKHLHNLLEEKNIKWKSDDHNFYLRFISNAHTLHELFFKIYGAQQNASAHFDALVALIISGYNNRAEPLKKRDAQKEKAGKWFLSNGLVGMSLYVDRFCGELKALPSKFDYLQELGVNTLHLMPLFQSPAEASDGGYAVSDFRKINNKFGNLEDLKGVQSIMLKNNMYLMVDIVLNHTSDQHEWAKKAAAGNNDYQEYYYMYPDRSIPDIFDQTMPEIFPETAPGNFTYIESCRKWVMSVFHNYQWDLNYSNPKVFNSMLDNIFFYANLGVDILRIDAPAFIWKQLGTTSQNLKEAHTLLQLIKVCVNIATPGMALLGEAIVAPDEIIKYFGADNFKARECDFAYNATQMAVQWDALATGDTRILLAAQQPISQKPFDTSWITYTRCHDDIGLGYTDEMIRSSGFEPYSHRDYIKNYYSGNYPLSTATGALFSFNPKTGDARISGTLASLCGLEEAIINNDPLSIETSIKKILLMQAMSLFVGGLPMLFCGDEVGYINDYSYLDDTAKSYDNRWMHRPIIDWSKNSKKDENTTIEHKIFDGLKKLIATRKAHTVVSDLNNITWMGQYNNHIAGFVRTSQNENIFCVFNFCNESSNLTWHAFKLFGLQAHAKMNDLISGQPLIIGEDHDYLILEPFGFCILSDKI